MAEIIVFPDVEALAVDVLNTDPRVPGSWSTKIPNPMPAEFGRVKRFGGPRESLISENANLIVEAWATTEARALEILNLARGVLASQDGPLFGYSEIGGPNNLPDPTVPAMARYTLNISVRARGSVLA
jgi:hypothetical protein